MSSQEKQNAKSETSDQSRNFGSRVFPCAFILIGVIAIGSVFWNILQGIKCERWPTTEGVIKTATISHGRKHELARISYDYKVAGIPYAGTRLAFGEDMEQGQRILDHYSVGQKVSVHYFPNKPQESVLETGIHGKTWEGLGMGTIFVLVGWMILQANLGGGRVKLQKPPTLVGVIIILAGSMFCMRELSGGTSNRIGYVVGGFLVLGGTVLLAYCLRNCQSNKKIDVQK